MKVFKVMLEDLSNLYSTIAQILLSFGGFVVVIALLINNTFLFMVGISFFIITIILGLLCLFIIALKELMMDVSLSKIIIKERERRGWTK